jgi:mannose-1-phosphate guanylyltransferase
MRAILLAAGFGTRLRPLTDKIPKCLVPIHGKPLLLIWLDRLSAVGFDSFLINTHYLPEQVEAFIEKSVYKNKVKLVHEPELRGTAGTLIANLDFFHGEDGMLLHADNYCLADMDEFKRAHFLRPKDCELTMMTFTTETPSQCGIVIVDEENKVIKFQEKNPHPDGNMANGAIYFLSSEMISHIRKDFSNVSDFSTQILPAFINKIYTYHTSAAFLDIGTPQAYKKANELPFAV